MIISKDILRKELEEAQQNVELLKKELEDYGTEDVPAELSWRYSHHYMSYVLVGTAPDGAEFFLRPERLG